jgi:DNA-binding response OmpR family regulator
MIYVVSSVAREADILAALCEQRAWPSQACRRVADFVAAADKTPPHAVIVRHRLEDGYSDDVLAYLGTRETPQNTPVIVLTSADCPVKMETRQVALGADHVFRDPVRIEVLLEVLNRCRSRSPATPSLPAAAPSYEFAGVEVFPREHRLTRHDHTVQTTPKVIEFVQILHRNADRVVPYTTLYDELFARRFSGDTSNCRVLLAKADGVFKRLGVHLRRHIEVIPKSGYLYRPRPGPSHRRSRTKPPHV